MNNPKMKLTEMVRVVTLGLLLLLPLASEAQQLLTLDSCRAMALRNNKQMGVAKMKQELSAYSRKAARAKYLPHVNAMGGYLWTSKEMSILNDDQKEALSNMGTNTTAKLQNALSPLTSALPAATQAKMAEDASIHGWRYRCCQQDSRPQRGDGSKLSGDEASGYLI